MNVLLHLTDACNFRCCYCLNRPGQLGPMSWDVAERAIDLVAGLSRGRVGVQFYGGEPLLEYDLLVRCVTYAQTKAAQHGLDVEFRVTSNGSLLTDAACETFRKAGLILTISSEGLPDRHDACRRFANGQPTSAVVEAAIQRALGAKVRLEVMMVLDPRYVEGIADSIAYLYDRGVRAFQLGLNHYAPWGGQQIRTLEQSIEQVGELYLQYAGAGLPINVGLLDEKLLVWAVRGYEDGRKCPSCQWLISVTPDGRLYRCRAFTSEYPGCPDSIGDVWQGIRPSSPCEPLESGRPQAARCRCCDLAPRCTYWCRCANLFTSGDPSIPGEVYCCFQAAAIRTAERIGESLAGNQRTATDIPVVANG